MQGTFALRDGSYIIDVVNKTPDIVHFLGHLHPMLVHLPIGFIILAAALEVLALFPRFRTCNSANGNILTLAAAASVITATCGWLLASNGGYDSHLLFLHRAAGIGTSVACLLAALLYWLGKPRAFKACLWLSVIVVTMAGHFGGALTHGSGYFSMYAPRAIRALFGATSANDPAIDPPPTLASNGNGVATNVLQDPSGFTALIQPIFQQNCISCHGEAKAKNGLRLDSFAAAIKGSKDGPVIVQHDAAKSELFKRLTLPVNDDDHMPPASKRQLKPDEIALIKWWIDAGAPAD